MHAKYFVVQLSHLPAPLIRVKGQFCEGSNVITAHLATLLPAGLPNTWEGIFKTGSHYVAQAVLEPAM